jgi:hypothetical protein
VTPHEPQAWVDAIEELESDAPLRERLGASARDFAERHCSEGVALAYLRTYLGEATGRAGAARADFARAA